MKITIITVCYNSEKNIEDTIKSVLLQTYANYEYLIIDGKSTDRTMDIVKKYEDSFKGKMKYISEADNGIYDAMNKGILMATGDIIGIINSDDVLIDENVFAKIVTNYKEDTDVLYANLIYCDANLENPIRDYHSGKRRSDAWCPAHPTMYIRKSVFERVGMYDLYFKVVADYDLMVRLNKSNVHFQYLDAYIVLMRMGGASNGLNGYIQNFKEAYRVLRKNHVYFAFLKTGIRTFMTLLQYIDTKIHKKRLQEILKRKSE